MPKLDLRTFQGELVVVAPHMDDEALACGGLISSLPDKDCVHIIYATDGMRSPAPIIPGRDQIRPDLGEIRMQESRKAMQLLGIPEQNLHFLGLPEAELQKNIELLRDLLRQCIAQFNPSFVLVPFRYDRHPDHLAINHVVAAAVQDGTIHAKLAEYFVYYRWRLLPKGDIRKYVRSEILHSLSLDEVASRKRQALASFASQTTIYYPWQTRPILTSTLLDEECQNPEQFLISSDSLFGPSVFTGLVSWIRIAHRLEPFLQRWKYHLGAFGKRVFRL